MRKRYFLLLGTVFSLLDSWAFKLHIPILDSWLETIFWIAAFLCFAAVVILWLKPRGFNEFRVPQGAQPLTTHERPTASNEKTSPGSGSISLDWQLDPPESL